MIKKKIGLDIGTVRIGIATSDILGMFASSYEVYRRRNLYLDAKYELFENVRVGLTLMPRLGIYDVYKATDQDKNTESVSGVKVNFGMPIVLGASYTF